MSKIEIDYQVDIEGRQSENGFFAPEERKIIDHYVNLLVSGEACVGYRTRISMNGLPVNEPKPFLDREAQVLLRLHGLDSQHPHILEELGRVWGFYEIFDRIEGRVEDLNDPADFIASQLGIQPEKLANGELSPGQKFKILSLVVVNCYPS